LYFSRMFLKICTFLLPLWMKIQKRDSSPTTIIKTTEIPN
jgi:hypothetical protein